MRPAQPHANDYMANGITVFQGRPLLQSGRTVWRSMRWPMQRFHVAPKQMKMSERIWRSSGWETEQQLRPTSIEDWLFETTDWPFIMSSWSLTVVSTPVWPRTNWTRTATRWSWPSEVGTFAYICKKLCRITMDVCDIVAYCKFFMTNTSNIETNKINYGIEKHRFSLI